MALFEITLDFMVIREIQTPVTMIAMPGEPTTIANRSLRSARIRTLHGLFEVQAIVSPDAVALISSGEQITYRQLDQRARVVADVLRRLDVKPETLVGLCVGRSPDLLSGILGILKAGGAYVPLNPRHPIQRHESTLADDGISIVLTNSVLLSRIPASVSQVICIDHLQTMLLPPIDESSAGGSHVDPAQSGNRLACRLYTFDSADRSKRIELEHGAVVDTVLDINRRLGINRSDRILGLASFGFDLSLYEMFGILAVGGTIVLPDERLAELPAHWVELIERYQITLWASVLASLETLIAYAAEQTPQALNSLRLVLLAGDWISLSLPGCLRELNPDTQIASLGGPTEVSIWSFLDRIGKVDPAWTSIPDAWPTDGRNFCILDEQLKPCPMGDAGQLFVGGLIVARGHYDRSELTTAKFVPEPLLDGNPAVRLIATGFRARLQADGTVDFLGEIDGKIAIRCYRVKLGEIEFALCGDSGVREAVVIAEEEVAGIKGLVVYVVANAEFAAGPEKYLEFLRRALPDHMVPARWLLNDRLRLPAGGKVDRAAPSLPKLQSSTATEYESSAAPCELPGDDVERRLVGIWERLFDRRPIGVEDSFIEVGGDSLLAIELFIQIEKDFGVRMAFDVLVEAPTIRSLGRLLAEPTLAKSPVLVTLQAGGARPPLFCLPGISGSLLDFQALANCLGSDQPVYGLRPRGSDGREPPHTSIDEWAAANVAVMRSLQPKGPYCLVGFSLGGVVAFEMARQLQAARQAIGSITLVDPQLWANFGHLPLSKRLRQHVWKLWHNDEGGRRRYLAARWRLLAARIRRRDLSHQPEDLVLGLDCPQQVRDMAKVHLAALQQYRPRIYHGPVTLFTASAAWSHTAGVITDPTLGWAQFVDGHIDVHEIPATHTQLLCSSHVHTLANSLLAGIDRVAAKAAEFRDRYV